LDRELEMRLGTASLRLARDLGWVGIGRVRWAVTADGGHFFLGFAPRLTLGFPLIERLYGVDLLETQLRLPRGEPLGWQVVVAPPLTAHGVQLRVLHQGLDARSRPDGVIEALDLPEEVEVERGTEVGQPACAETDPLLATLMIVAPTRHAALVRARVAVDSS